MLARTVAPLLIGAAIGSAITWSMLREHRVEGDDSPSAASVAGVAPTADASPAAELPAGSTPDQYLSAYRAAEQLTDPEIIEATLIRLLAEPYSIDRDAGIAASFHRLAALDLRRAVRLAESPGFDTALIAGVFRTLAEADVDAALQALTMVQGSTLQVELAVAVLEALGNDADGLAEVAASLPMRQRAAFQIEALGAAAKSDPNRAMSTALSLGDFGVRSAAAQRIGVEWARQDPMRAFSLWTSLPNDLQTDYRDTVAAEWASLDSREFLDFADSQPTLDNVLMGLMHTLGVDPERTFEVASSHPPINVADRIGQAFTVERTAFTSAAELDPERYRAIVEAMPEGARKTELAPAFIEMYARTDPLEALAWARNQPDRTYEGRTIRNIAPVDYELSYRLMIEFVEKAGSFSRAEPIASFIGVFAATDPRRGEFATRLLQSDEVGAAQVLDQVMLNWVQSEPESALEWMLQNGSEIDPAQAANIAGSLSARDARTAATYLERLPAALRQSWMEQVAAPYARQDPEAAATWMLQFQGQPGYDAMFMRVVQQTARTDPVNAALMIASAPAEQQRSVAPGIASGYARKDLAGAARWAVSLSDDAARSRAIDQVASSWALRDPRAAQRWAQNLPGGELRDQALVATLTRLSRDGFDVTIDPDIFDAFESQSVRNQQVGRLVAEVALRDPERAEAYLEEWATDPDLRAQGERLIEDARRMMGL